jgi:cysteine desulfurase family protein
MMIGLGRGDEMKKQVYLDNASTSWPKPPSVIEAMIRFNNEIGANPGRSGHRMSTEAGRIVLEARERVAKIFNIEDPMRIAFGLNATDGLNLGIRGTLKKGDHAITSSMEHNSVSRPLSDLEKAGKVEVTVMQCSKEGFLDPSDVQGAIKKNTRLIVMNHGSNVVVNLLPLREVGKMARENGITFMIDSAQTGGCIEIDSKADLVDMIGFTGHKGLLGPQGTGGLAIGDNVDIEALDYIRSGGTGGRSEDKYQPESLPDKYECGTLNTIGLAGLAAGIEFIMNETIDKIHKKEMGLTRMFIQGLKDIPGLTLYGGHDETRKIPTLSINFEGLGPKEAGAILDKRYGIMVRTGLHCAPTAHRTIGTFPDGTVRLASGYFTTEEEVKFTIDACKEITEKKG